MMSRYGTYNAILLACAIAIVGGVATINLIVDPYSVSHLVPMRFNQHRPEAWEHARLFKVFDIWRGNYDGIVLGSSQVERGFRTQTNGSILHGVNLYNAGLSEERTYEEALLLRHAIETGNIKLAVISLEFLRYLPDPNNAGHLPNNWTRWQSVQDYLKSLISWASLLDSFKTVKLNRLPLRNSDVFQHYPGGLLNAEDVFNRLGTLDYLALFDKSNGELLNFPPRMLECRRQLEVSGFDHSSIKEMIQLAKQHKQHNVRLYFFIPPNHATHEETLRLLGLTSLFHQWLREISDLLARQTEREDTDLFQLWDFSGYNIVTMEPIPPQNSPVHMRGYFDPIHYTTWVGSEILKVLLQQPGPDTELADFGVRVDRRSISAHLERQNQNRMLYLTAHPEIPQQIKALYKGDKPATGSAHASPTPADCSAS